MTTFSAQDRTHESVINGVLAQLLQEHFKLSAVAETLHESGRPDIVVRLPQGPVIVETEVEPAYTVEADALARLGILIDGKLVQNVFAVKIPEQLRTASQQLLRERALSANIEWQEWRIDGSSGPKQRGQISDLAGVVGLITPFTDNLQEAVGILDKGARQAGALLHSSPGTLARVAQVFGASQNDEAANMAALVIINAMTFQERLASAESAYRSVKSAQLSNGFSADLLMKMWDEILEIDYYPIFRMARDVVEQLSGIEASGVLEKCHATADELLATGAVGRHDLAGRIFNQLVSERELLAAYYTTIPSSTLLAGLALSPDMWPEVNWGDAEKLSHFRVVDAACGTGTLLMAAYRQILQNHSAAENPSLYDPKRLHQALVEAGDHGRRCCAGCNSPNCCHTCRDVTICTV